MWYEHVYQENPMVTLLPPSGYSKLREITGRSYQSRSFNPYVNEVGTTSAHSMDEETDTCMFVICLYSVVRPGLTKVKSMGS